MEHPNIKHSKVEPADRDESNGLTSPGILMSSPSAAARVDIVACQSDWTYPRKPISALSRPLSSAGFSHA
jgi:hypothetical protein